MNFQKLQSAQMFEFQKQQAAKRAEFQNQMLAYMKSSNSLFVGL